MKESNPCGVGVVCGGPVVKESKPCGVDVACSGLVYPPKPVIPDGWVVGALVKASNPEAVALLEDCEGAEANISKPLLLPPPALGESKADHPLCCCGGAC